MVPAQSLKTAILTGTTASGKTALALELARANRAIEIVNADSLLIYRGMDIGTAKPAGAELAEIPHHLIDIRDPGETYTAGDFRRDALAAIEDIERRGKRALVVGGTGFYLKALLYGLWEAPPTDAALRDQLAALENAELFRRLDARDPESAARIGANDRYRLIRANEILELSGRTPTELESKSNQAPDPRFELLITDRENEELYERISARARAMLKDGLLEETRALRERFPGARALASVGYAETCDYLDGKKPEGRKTPEGLAGLQSEIELATRQLVKRQRTWFRGQCEARFWILDRERGALRSRLEELYA